MFDSTVYVSVECVSCYSVHDRHATLTYTVLSNTTGGAWPVARLLDERLAG